MAKGRFIGHPVEMAVLTETKTEQRFTLEL